MGIAAQNSVHLVKCQRWPVGVIEPALEPMRLVYGFGNGLALRASV
jgi:hypothetical protein